MWSVFLSIRKLTWKVCTTAPVESILHVQMMSYQEEPFYLWTKWAGQYSPESPERQLLEASRIPVGWSTSHTHHDLEALWRFLFDISLGMS